MHATFWHRATLACISVIALTLAACGSTATVTTKGAAPATATTAPLPSIVTTQQSKSGVDATAAQISVTATCPAGTTLLSGGYSLGLANTMQLVEITDDYPSAPGAWTATEVNPQTGGAITLTAYAYCLKTTTVSTNFVNAPSNTDGTGVVACPTGQTITGGGFKQAGQIATSYPVLNTWHTAFLSGVVSPPPYVVYAVCANAGLAPATISSGSSGAVANNASGAASATCATGQLLTGGGYVDANGAFSLDTDLTLSATAFAVKALNLYIPAVAGPGGAPPTPTPLQVMAYAICVTPA